MELFERPVVALTMWNRQALPAVVVVVVVPNTVVGMLVAAAGRS